MPFTPLNGLHAFTVVARRSSFSAAARELGVSPSALSQAVRQLEERLDVVLLTRTTRSVAATKAGLRLLEASGAALEQALEGLRTVTHETGELTGTIRLTVPEMVTEHVFASILPRYLAAHPRVTFEFSVESRRVDIVRHGFDAGVRTEGIPKDMVRLRLADPFRIVVAGAPAYLRGTASRRGPKTSCTTGASEWTTRRALPGSGTSNGARGAGRSRSSRSSIATSGTDAWPSRRQG